MDYVFGKYVLGLLLFMKLLDFEGDDCVLGINLFIYLYVFYWKYYLLKM